MYTRSTPGGQDELRIPENYRGNAFHGDANIPTPPIEPSFPPAPVSDGVEENTAVLQPTVLSSDLEKPSKQVLKKSPFSPLLPPRMSGGGLLGDIGIEELLIIGVLILLSQSETDDDILLLLVLLLFYK